MSQRFRDVTSTGREHPRTKVQMTSRIVGRNVGTEWSRKDAQTSKSVQANVEPHAFGHTAGAICIPSGAVVDASAPALLRCFRPALPTRWGGSRQGAFPAASGRSARDHLWPQSLRSCRPHPDCPNDRCQRLCGLADEVVVSPRQVIARRRREAAAIQ